MSYLKKNVLTCVNMNKNKQENAMFHKILIFFDL